MSNKQSDVSNFLYILATWSKFLIICFSFMDVAKAKKLTDYNDWKKKITCGFLALRRISDQIKVAIWQENPNLGW